MPNTPPEPNQPKTARSNTKAKKPVGPVRRLWRIAWRSTAGLIAVALVAYGVLAWIYWTGTPNPTVDYYAKLNEINAGYSEEEKALPVYQEVYDLWKPIEDRLRDMPDPEPGTSNYEDNGYSYWPNVPTDHPDAEVIRETVREFRPHIDRLIEASNRPRLGAYYTDRPPPAGLLDEDPPPLLSPTSIVAQQAPLAFSMGRPEWKSATTTSWRILDYEARESVREGDPERWIEIIEAVANACILIRQEPDEFHALVGASGIALLILHIPEEIVAIRQMADAETLDRARRAVLSISEPSAAWIPSVGMRIDDMLQRAYTDDGNGDGRGTPDILKFLESMPRVYPEEETGLREKLQARLVAPITNPLDLSRTEIVHFRDEITKGAHAMIDAGPWALGPGERTVPQELRSPIRHAYLDWLRLRTAGVTVPSLLEASVRAKATVTVLAIETYRANQGSLPPSLDALIPDLIPFQPIDPLAPETELLYALDEDSPLGYLLYSRGPDGDDDQRRPYVYGNWPSFAVNRVTTERIFQYGGVYDGDWLIVPQAELAGDGTAR